MMYDRILLRFGDLTLKGKNKKRFIESLYNQVKYKLKDTKISILNNHDRMYVLLNDEDINKVINILNTVSGLRSYSLVVKTTKDIEDIKNTALSLVKEEIAYKTTFKVEAKRSDKQYSITSPELQKIVAGFVLKNTDNLKVDVKNPKKTLNVEVRTDAAYMYFNVIPAIGGFPVGIAGKGLLTLSGGIDSPVAGYLAMKQGIEIEAIHFESTPLTSVESVQKVIDLSKMISKYNPRNRIKLHLVPFKELHTLILNSSNESYNITLMRRYFYKISQEFARRTKSLVLVNGESVGQVASQTLESMNTIANIVNIPIVRPLTTMDKIDIIKLSRQIGAYETSIKPFEDCCTVYIPKNPTTKPKVSICEELEKEIESNKDFNKIYEDTINNIVTIDIDNKSDLDITLDGLEIQEIFSNKV